ncbi:glycerol-3-phosphate dehydrogenase/oxidase [Maribacter sp. ACAM166]|uniref:glycerol-3-phosphate dehydrogenase/oxidase n=1 Tax=Maribacter sp. ACAM166 TaxID=2508996 RepID=UPI0010FD9A68|nr:glycerol-3-phosphate dehydrogenase/oxidase [Maribacter sp. ACAM166]TLP70526.1 glycerol-3-phosphate dehydrogenase/oxidase [Maribacter sp. ACAM166]
MHHSVFDRKVITAHLENETDWDLIIIGGGATGLGIAMDGVTRGYKTLLVEQSDFAKGTSSRSTKLVHGGVRYLAQGNIDLVREALYERGLLLKNAPHLTKNQSFIIPSYSWWNAIFYTTGLKVYDFLSGKLSLGNSSFLTKSKTLQRIETIRRDKLKGGVVYQDGQFDDARLAVNIAQTCLEKGATLLNYFKVTDLLKKDNGSIRGVAVTDRETDRTYTLNGKVIINATGVFADDILKLDNPKGKNMIRPSQGIHLVLDSTFLPGKDAIMIPKTDDGRVLFLVPWHGKVVVGTTDTLIDEHSIEPRALEKEIDFILSNANAYLTKEVTKKDVLSIFAGLRPLAAPADKTDKTKEISRSHKIVTSNSGLISVIGGKWTTFRRMAQDTIDNAIRLKMLPKKHCVTQDLRIHGAKESNDRSDHLYVYGSDQEGIHELINEKPKLGKRIHSEAVFLKAEVVWAARYEMARTVEDVLARRVRLLFLNARVAIESARVVAAILAEELGKDGDWELEQVRHFTGIASHYMLDETDLPKGSPNKTMATT